MWYLFVLKKQMGLFRQLENYKAVNWVILDGHIYSIDPWHRFDDYMIYWTEWNQQKQKFFPKNYGLDLINGFFLIETELDFH